MRSAARYWPQVASSLLSRMGLLRCGHGAPGGALENSIFKVQQRARTEVRFGSGKYVGEFVKNIREFSDDSRNRTRSMEAEDGLSQMWGRHCYTHSKAARLSELKRSSKAVGGCRSGSQRSSREGGVFEIAGMLLRTGEQWKM